MPHKTLQISLPHFYMPSRIAKYVHSKTCKYRQISNISISPSFIRRYITWKIRGKKKKEFEHPSIILFSNILSSLNNLRNCASEYFRETALSRVSFSNNPKWGGGRGRGQGDWGGGEKEKHVSTVLIIAWLINAEAVLISRTSSDEAEPFHKLLTEYATGTTI